MDKKGRDIQEHFRNQMGVNPAQGNDQGYAIFPLGNAGLLRDFFAGQAIAGMLVEIGKQVAAANRQSGIIGLSPNIAFGDIAKDAYKLADAMMSERRRANDRTQG